MLALFGGAPVRQKMLSFFRLKIEEDEYVAVNNVLSSGQISRGIKPIQFEKKFCEYVGVSHGVVVSSGTAALHLAMKSLDLPINSLVIMPALSFVATAFAAEYSGLKPIFVDVEPDTYNLDPKKLIELLEIMTLKKNHQVNKMTKAILPVHYGGRPCDIEKIKDVANGYGLKIIEDAAHAIGAVYESQKKKQKIKSFKVGCCKYSDLTCFSFFATKNITGGEGGIITTNDEKIAAKVRKMKAHGIVPLDSAPKASGYYDVQKIGYNYHLSNINIAILEAQLKKIDSFNNQRKKNANYLSYLLGDLKEIKCPQYHDGYDHVFHIYTITLQLHKLKATRDEVIRALLAEGIQAGVYYRPIHLFTYFKKKHRYKKGDLPVTENLCDSLITLPMYPLLTKKDIEDIAEATCKVIDYYKK